MVWRTIAFPVCFHLYANAHYPLFSWLSAGKFWHFILVSWILNFFEQESIFFFLFLFFFFFLFFFYKLELRWTSGLDYFCNIILPSISWSMLFDIFQGSNLNNLNQIMWTVSKLCNPVCPWKKKKKKKKKKLYKNKLKWEINFSCFCKVVS